MPVIASQCRVHHGADHAASLGLYSKFWTLLFVGIVAAFPIAVLLLVQINALRYQSDLIVWVQRIWLALDLAALVWFFRRNTLDGSVWPERRPARIRRWVGLLWAPILIGAVNLIYLDTVPGDADAGLVRYDRTEPDWLRYNPLDALCPQLNWGCRFLRVDHRTLVDKVWDEKAMAVLRMQISKPEVLAEPIAPGDNPNQKAIAELAERRRLLAAIEGVSLRFRSLRFAVLNESRLFAADLIDANLSGAQLIAANLSGANLSEANLSGVYLIQAHLSRADLNRVYLNEADLIQADLSEADLSEANLSGAYLNNANLSHVNLSHANLSGAKGVVQPQLDQACGEGADLPPGLTLKPCPKR